VNVMLTSTSIEVMESSPRSLICARIYDNTSVSLLCSITQMRTGQVS
jgi:hypothetical protein